jgi:hypothetical protein
MGLLLVAAVLTAASTTLAEPGRANANSTIAAEGRFVAVAWSASLASGQTDVFSAVSRDGAVTFDAPVRVNDVDGDARVSGEQPPHVALVTSAGRVPSIVVLWTTKGPRGTRIVQSRSDDGGRTFSNATAIPGGDAEGARGWEAVAAARGIVHAVWLDHREMAAHDGHMSHMSPDRSRLYFASVDGSLAPRALTNAVCYCCKTALAVGADGAIYTAWRHVYPGNVRDIAMTVSRDGGRTFAAPVRISEDNWILDGCPDDGPAIAVDAGSRVHVVWPTLVRDGSGEPTIALFYASSRDGKRFSPRQRLPTEGLPHHPQIALRPDGSPVLAWDEVKDGIRKAVAAAASVDSKGVATFMREAIPQRSTSLYPVVTTTTDGVVVAWTSGGASDSTIEVWRLR